jgi:glycosyltransferase involved in cell wall biosynthesis
MTARNPLLFVFREGWVGRCRQVMEGSFPAEAHGYFVLANKGMDVDAVDSSLSVSPLWRLASQLYQRLYVIPRSGMGYRIHQARSVRRYVRNDSERWLIATTDSLALPLLALKARRRLPNPVIAFSIGLCDRIERGIVSPQLVRRYRTLLGHAAAILVYERADADLLRAWVPETLIRTMPYGVDVDWWANPTGSDDRGVRILSVGRDSSRNFPTLVAAVEGLTIPTTIVSPIARRQGVSESQRVRLIEDATMLELRNLLWQAKLVVLPIKNVKQPSGQSSALQAMAAGKPVILTDTGWAQSYGLRDRVHFFHVPPEDPKALRRAIEDLLALPDQGAELGARGQAVVRDKLTSAQQASAILDAIADAR